MAALSNGLAAGGAVARVTEVRAGVGAAWGPGLGAALLTQLTLQTGETVGPVPLQDDLSSVTADRRHLITAVHQVALPPTGVVPTGQRSPTGTPAGEASTAVTGNRTDLGQDRKLFRKPTTRQTGGVRQQRPSRSVEDLRRGSSCRRVLRKAFRMCCPLLVSLSQTSVSLTAQFKEPNFI